MREKYMVIELCQNCDMEIEMVWDTKGLGYKAFCPVFGQRLMLCDECLHTDGLPPTCDYNRFTDTCKFSETPFLYSENPRYRRR